MSDSGTTLYVNYGGKLLNKPKIYSGGWTHKVKVDLDYLCTRDIDGMHAAFGYHKDCKVYFLKHGCSLEDGLILIKNDHDILELIKTANARGKVDLYVDHELPQDHPDYELNKILVASMKEKPQEEEVSSAPTPAQPAMNLGDSDEDDSDYVDEEHHSSDDEEYDEVIRQSQNFENQMKNGNDGNVEKHDTDEWSDNMEGDDGEREAGGDDDGEREAERDDTERVVNEEAPSNSDDDERASEIESEKECESLYDSSDELVSLDEDSDELPDETEVNSAGPQKISRRKNVKRAVIQFDPKTKRKKIEFMVGMLFTGVDQFKEAVRGYAIGQGKNVHYVVNAGKRWQVKCEPNCQWQLWASVIDTSGTVMVKTYEKTHVCGRIFKNKMGTTKWLAMEIE